MTDRLDRRTILVGAAGGVAALAGCAGQSDGTDGTTADTPSATGTATGSGQAAGSTTTATLDLREANVTGVEIESTADGYDFAVTLYHDDDGEDGYANWWQVERLDGTKLGRRDLTHAHGTREFTRSATIAVPDDVSCVVVRGHDQTHGYGGQAMTVRLDDGATTAVRQGPAPKRVVSCAGETTTAGAPSASLTT
jgi:hypothetical protein